MRSRFSLGPTPSDAAEFDDEIRRAFADLGKSLGAQPFAGHCEPPVDVYESDQSVDIVMDLPGVEAAALRVVAKRDTVIIVGEKIARRSRGEASFHLVERDFGRFVRTVRVLHPCDVNRARAQLAHGELHIRLPKIAERRGKTISIRVETPKTSA